MYQHKQAFTLIELLVVVLIIGILAAVALPQYKIAVAKSNYATMKSVVESLAKAQEIYYLANGKYATTFSDLDIEPPVGDRPNAINTVSESRYTWGYCNIATSWTGGVGCRMNRRAGLDIGYEITGSYSSMARFKGKRACVVYDDSDGPTLSTKICQQETGKTDKEPISGWPRYFYN